MFRGVLKACILAGCFSLISIAASSQEVVHALTGTVATIDTAAKTISVYTDSRSEGLFKDMTNSKTPIEFDKSIRADTTAADAYKKKGTYAIVLYYGGGDTRTAVALRSLGPGPFAKDTGTVTKFEDKGHSISIRDNSGTLKSFNLTSDTVAETEYGAVGGFKYQPHKGDKVRVISTTTNGNNTALFINTLVAN